MIYEFTGDEIANAVGMYVVLYMLKSRTKCVGKVLLVNTEKKHIRYDVMSGPNKGRIMMGRYAKSGLQKAYDEDSLVKALLEV